MFSHEMGFKTPGAKSLIVPIICIMSVDLHWRFDVFDGLCLIVYRLFYHLRKSSCLNVFVEEAFGLGVLMSLVEVIFLHRKRNSGVGGGVQCPTGRVFQYRVGYWKSFMTPFLHSRTTFKNRPPLHSTFWNRSNLVMYDNIYVGFSSSRAGAELGIDEEAVSKWLPSTIRCPSQKQFFEC